MKHANISDSTPKIILKPRLPQTPATSSVVDEDGNDDSVEESELQTKREDSEGVLDEDEPDDEEPRPSRPAWRTLPRSSRRIPKPRPTIEFNLIVPDEGSPGLFGPRSPRSYEPHLDQLPPSEPGPAPMRQPVHSWVTWHPNPALAPTPPPIEPRLIVPDEGSPGLFGPRSPCSYGPHLDQPPPMRQPVHSWVTWHPNPALVPTPPPIEPRLIVPDEGSPSLFGPRSPRSYEPHLDQLPPSEPGPAPMRQPVHSWVTWHPNPALAPTPPPIEPHLIVPDEGSPGLFGPRSPCSYR